jgi:hypothetical protein
MYVVSTDPVIALRAELRRSLLRPSLVRRLWYWLVLGRTPLSWREPGYRVGMPATQAWRAR